MPVRSRPAPSAGPRAESPAPLGDRRVWIRHQAQVPALCQHADVEDEAPVSALVTGISRASMSLVVDRLFAPGALISIELPAGADGAAMALLAHVIRVTATEDHQWALGCTFAAELDEQELAVFGADKVKPPANDERTWVRYRCDLPIFYDLIDSDDALPSPGRLMDISASGVGLRLAQRVEVGSVLQLELPGPPGRDAYRMLACVVRINGPVEGRWLAGCTFIRELKDAELQPVLDAARAADASSAPVSDQAGVAG